eukprot:4667131-Amphidinium_carterae.1
MPTVRCSDERHFPPLEVFVRYATCIWLHHVSQTQYDPVEFLHIRHIASIQFLFHVSLVGAERIANAIEQSGKRLTLLRIAPQQMPGKPSETPPPLQL